MSTNTSIEWTDATWSPIRARVRQDAAEIAKAKGYNSLVSIAAKMAGHVGPHCERVSHGCDNCYAETNNHRCLPSNGTGLPYDRRSRDLVEHFVDEKILLQPLKWKLPRNIFVINQSDLFGEWVTDEQIDLVFAVMALCQRHTFQVLTKRSERLLEHFQSIPFGGNDGAHDTWQYRIAKAWSTWGDHKPNWTGTPLATLEGMMRWPLSNVWLGVSVENQETADERIPLLLKTPATVRFVSAEPLLGPITLTALHFNNEVEIDALNGTHGVYRPLQGTNAKLTWVIDGGESGPGARPAPPEWFRQIRDDCAAAGVAYFHKQNGNWSPSPLGSSPRTKVQDVPVGDGTHHRLFHVGKKAAGALLDGELIQQFPEVSAHA
jgi:protein gp37